MMDMEFGAAMFQALLTAGAKADAGNDEGITLLHIVTDARAVEPLVTAGGNLEARDIRGQTPLLVQAAEARGDTDIISALLAAGADVNAVDNNGETALDFARMAQDAVVEALLIDAGAGD